VVGEFPDSMSSLRHLALLLEAKDKTKECEKVIENALTRIEQSSARRYLGLLLAGFYNRWEEQEKRYQLLNSLEKELPYDILVKRELLKCPEVKEDPNRAQQLVDKIRAMEGEGGWQWRYEQAKLWYERDDFNDLYPKIISLLKENLLFNLDDQDSRILLAASYEKTGELRIAISTYRQALDRSPKNINIIIAYVHALYKAKEYDLADEILQRAAGEKLSHPELKKLEVQSYLRRGELASAGDILEELLKDDPNDHKMGLSLALIRIRQKKFVEAGRLLDGLKNQAPDSLEIKVAQIELYVLQGKAAEALLLCDNIVNRWKNASAYIIRAGTFVSLDQTDKAMEDFEYATVIEPNNVEAWVAKSDFYHSIRQPDKAIADIQKALSLAPNHVKVQKLAIKLLLASGNPRKILRGRAILDQAIKENPEDVELHLSKARVLISEETAPALDNADKILQKITEEQPKVTKAWVLLGELLIEKAEYREAVNIAWRGLAHTPKDRELLLLKFKAEKELSLDLAIPTLKLLYEMDTNDVDITVLLAGTYVESDEHERAISLLKKQLVSCDDASDARKVNIALAGILYKSDDKQQAQKIFDSLYQSDPNDPAPLLVQVRLLKKDKLWDRISRMVAEWCRNHPKDTRTPVAVAIDLKANEDSQAKMIAENILRKILDRDANSLPAMDSLAILLQVTGRHAESAELYKRILEIQPDNIIAINNLAWTICEEQGEYQQALQLAMRGLDIVPYYADLIDTCGVAHYRLRQYDQAVQCFTKCLKLYPDGIPAENAAYFHLGRALAKLGQKDDAVGNLNKALELNAENGGLSPEDIEETKFIIKEIKQGS
ncbi:MAG: tetratricopeptide repeat protein, partial [Planctomycetota bacterium]